MWLLVKVKEASESSEGSLMAKMAPSSTKLNVLLLMMTSSQATNWKDSVAKVLKMLCSILTEATVALIAPCLAVDWISECVRRKEDTPATTDFWDRELMLHLWKLRREMAAVLEKALRSILWIVESLKLMLLMNSPEKALVAIFSIRLCSMEIDLKEEGKTLEDREKNFSLIFYILFYVKVS